jgi:hypothetical protein
MGAVLHKLYIDTAQAPAWDDPAGACFGGAASHLRVEISGKPGFWKVFIDVPGGCQSRVAHRYGRAAGCSLRPAGHVCIRARHMGCGRGCAWHHAAELPPQGRTTYALILEGGPFPYDKDGAVFGNRERALPANRRGYYREYTVKTPRSRDRGARRIVCGGQQPQRPMRATTPATTTAVSGRSRHELPGLGLGPPEQRHGELPGQPAVHPALQNPAFLGFARTTESTTEMEKRPLRPENDTPLRGCAATSCSRSGPSTSPICRKPRPRWASISCTPIWPTPRTSPTSWS